MSIRPSTVVHAQQELELLGTEQQEVKDLLLELVMKLAHIEPENIVFILQNLPKLLQEKPLSPLTGAEDEWEDVTELYPEAEHPIYQNRRYRAVYKDGSDVFDTCGKVFIATQVDEHGESQKRLYTSPDSYVAITFPYIPDPEYIEIS